jgi:hypothetical protein
MVKHNSTVAGRSVTFGVGRVRSGLLWNKKSWDKNILNFSELLDKRRYSWDSQRLF